MGTFSRLRYVIAANVNALLEKAEDPEKLLRALIREMEDASEEARMACADLLAEQQRLHRQEARLTDDIREWRHRAENAVTQDRDDLARAALKACAELEEQHRAVIDEQKRVADRVVQMEQDMMTLKTKLAEANLFARDLQNAPGNMMRPRDMAAAARKLAVGRSRVSCRVLTRPQLKQLGMGALLSVSRGSRQPAKLIVMEYKGGKPGEATQDLILKISVQGDVDQFAWVVPLPSAPQTGEEDAKLFEELHKYVQARLVAGGGRPKKEDGLNSAGEAAPATARDVEVISRETVGSFDVSIVKENRAGSLNQWLTNNKYQPVPGGDEVIEWYREKGMHDLPYPPIRPGENAAYAIDESLDLSAVVPMIAKPFSPGNAFPAEEVAREKIGFDKAYIGSCTNGRYEDFEAAAREHGVRCLRIGSVASSPRVSSMVRMPRSE